MFGIVIGDIVDSRFEFSQKSPGKNSNCLMRGVDIRMIQC